MIQEPKLKAYVIEKTAPDKNGNAWGIVNCTELTDDGVWHLGLTLITSIEDVAEKAAEAKVPIYPREYLEYLKTIKILMKPEISQKIKRYDKI
jgi:hypothetical protein